MRETKFRAWDRNRKKMSKPFFMDCLRNGYFIDKEGTVEATTFYLSDCDLIQYTGLKDKNGKEIYEGDVVRQVSDRIYPYEYDPEKVGEPELHPISVIEFYEDFWAWTLKAIHSFVPIDPSGHYVIPGQQRIIWKQREGYINCRDQLNNRWNQDLEVIGNIYDNPEQVIP